MALALQITWFGVKMGMLIYCKNYTGAFMCVTYYIEMTVFGVVYGGGGGRRKMYVSGYPRSVESRMGACPLAEKRASLLLPSQLGTAVFS